MGFHRKANNSNLDLAGYEFSDLLTGVTWEANTEKTLITGCPENIFKLYYTTSDNVTIKKGETKTFSWRMGAYLHNITLTATSDKVTVLSDKKCSGDVKLQGYRAVYYDYPTEEVAAATTALYTLDEAADVIAQEVAANE